MTPVTPKLCMLIGMDEYGPSDCSSLVIKAMLEAMGLSVNKHKWPSELRHARQMFAALCTAGETGRPLIEATPADIGNVVFSRGTEAAQGRFAGRVIHVTTLSGFTEDGRPMVIETSEGEVVEQPPPTETRVPLERIMFSPIRLAELALAGARMSGSLDF